MLPRFLAHFYAIFLYFVQTNIGLPQKVIKLLFFVFRVQLCEVLKNLSFNSLNVWTTEKRFHFVSKLINFNRKKFSVCKLHQHL